MQYAGNVLVYGAMSPCDGDWFGGVNKSNAASFLDAVINAEVSLSSMALYMCLLHNPCIQYVAYNAACDSCQHDFVHTLNGVLR